MGNGGWLISKNAPEVDGSYDLNRRVAKISEEMGLDYAIAMAKWRGYGGTTDYWEKTRLSFDGLRSRLGGLKKPLRVSRPRQP